LRLQPGTKSKNLDWAQNLHSRYRNASTNFYRIPYCLDFAISFAAFDGFTRAASHTASFIE